MAEQAKAQEDQPKDNKKIFIIIGAVLAALAVGGGGMYLIGGKGGGAKHQQEPAKAEGAAASGEHGAAKEGETAAASSSYALEPFIVNIYDGQEMRYLKLKVEFELSSSLAKAEIDSHLAPLRDAILILLTTKTMQEIQDLQGKNTLREQILAAAAKTVPGKVTKVYFTDFVVQ
jgi:flagellar FliL protein